MQYIAPPFAPYPSRTFPGLLGEMMDCLSLCGIAAEIIGTQLIAFVSLLTQGVADVVWPNGIKAPVGANCLLVAPSGTGKSLIFKILSDPVEQYLANHADICDPARAINLLIEDATRQAIVQSLLDWPVAGLFTDEAGMLKSLLKDSPTLVKLLDGSPLRNSRISTGRAALFYHRFCMLLMEQPDVFDETKILLGVGKGGVGLCNRIFFTLFNGNLPSTSLHMIALPASVKQAYAKKVKELLDLTIKHVDAKIGERPALLLSEEAAQYLNDIGNKARRNSALGSPWFFISEYISRHAERVLRLAGAFHVFEYGTAGEISLETIQRAATLDGWHIEAFAQMAYVAPKQTQSEADATQLKEAFRQIYRTTGNTKFRQSEMRSSSVNIGMTPARFNRGLSILGGQGSIHVVVENGKPWVILNTAHFF